VGRTGLLHAQILSLQLLFMVLGFWFIAAFLLLLSASCLSLLLLLEGLLVRVAEA